MEFLTLSILETGLIHPPQLHAYETINALLGEVGQLDALGYKRLWLTEHYSPEFAWFDPQALLPLLAGYSEKIKIGMAGVLLSYHAPMRVAQSFKLLSAIYNGRIDLGIARAYVAENASRFLVAPAQNIQEEWEYKVAELCAFVHEKDPAQCLMGNMILPPHGTELPDVWMLGSSAYSLATAVKNRCHFCISFIHPSSDFNKNRDVIKKFKQDFFDQHGFIPQTAALLYCMHEKDEKACRLLESRCPPHALGVFGVRAHIHERLRELKVLLDCDDLILSNFNFDRQERIASFAAIME